MVASPPTLSGSCPVRTSPGRKVERPAHFGEPEDPLRGIVQERRTTEPSGSKGPPLDSKCAYGYLGPGFLQTRTTPSVRLRNSVDKVDT